MYEFESYKIPRHKVFISYHHALDNFYKTELIKRREYNYDSGTYQSVFDDYSVRENDVDDTGLTDEQIRKIIRDDYIRGASVLILLCGEETKNRKFIDWELHAAMYNSDDRPKLGIIVINIPPVENRQMVRANDNEEKQLVINYCSNWHSCNSRSDYERDYPYMPNRIIDNFESGINYNDITPIIVANWSSISGSNVKLKKLIDKAFNYSRNENTHYNHSTPLRRRNG